MTDQMQLQRRESKNKFTFLSELSYEAASV